MLRRQVTLLSAADLGEYLLRKISIFNGVTNKFRIIVDDENEAERLIADIAKLNLLHQDVFDITSKKYNDGWCVRISWVVANGPLVEEVLAQWDNIRALPLVRRMAVHGFGCGTPLQKGVCPVHHFAPSLQDTAIAFYCAACCRELGSDNICPACKKMHRKY